MMKSDKKDLKKLVKVIKALKEEVVTLMKESHAKETEFTVKINVSA